MESDFQGKTALWICEVLPEGLSDASKAISQCVVVDAQNLGCLGTVLVVFEEDAERVQEAR